MRSLQLFILTNKTAFEEFRTNRGQKPFNRDVLAQLVKLKGETPVENELLGHYSNLLQQKDFKRGGQKTGDLLKTLSEQILDCEKNPKLESQQYYFALLDLYSYLTENIPYLRMHLTGQFKDTNDLNDAANQGLTKETLFFLRSIKALMIDKTAKIELPTALNFGFLSVIIKKEQDRESKLQNHDYRNAVDLFSQFVRSSQSLVTEAKGTQLAQPTSTASAANTSAAQSSGVAASRNGHPQAVSGQPTLTTATQSTAATMTSGLANQPNSGSSASVGVSLSIGAQTAFAQPIPIRPTVNVAQSGGASFVSSGAAAVTAGETKQAGVSTTSVESRQNGNPVTILAALREQELRTPTGRTTSSASASSAGVNITPPVRRHIIQDVSRSEPRRIPSSQTFSNEGNRTQLRSEYSTGSLRSGSRSNFKDFDSEVKSNSGIDDENASSPSESVSSVVPKEIDEGITAFHQEMIGRYVEICFGPTPTQPQQQIVEEAIQTLIPSLVFDFLLLAARTYHHVETDKEKVVARFAELMKVGSIHAADAKLTNFYKDAKEKGNIVTVENLYEL